MSVKGASDETRIVLAGQRADIAVHSMKDVPVEFPEGLG
ncbi:hypothetical protein ACTXQV_71310, partial [Klebsiella pneumoniae]